MHKTYSNILCGQILIWNQNNFGRVTSKPGKPFKGSRLRKTSYKDLVFARSEFLMFFGDPNESLRLIIIYYIFKYAFGVKKTLLMSLRSENSLLNARFRQN